MIASCKHNATSGKVACLICAREKHEKSSEKKEHDEAIKRILEKASKLDW